MLRRRWSGILVGLSVCVAGPPAQAAWVYLFPMAASGSYTLTTEGITLHGGGQRVFLEIYILGWTPHLLKTWQVGIDSSGYSSGSAGVLSPAFETCTGNAECVTAFGTGATCSSPLYLDNECTPGFIDVTRTNYVFRGANAFPTIDMSTENYRYAAVILSGAPMSDPGGLRYAGTLVLDVPVGAAGTFTIGYLASPDTALIDASGQFITPLFTTPGRITIGCDPSSCDDDNACTDDGCGAGTQCTHDPNYNDGLYCCYPPDRTLCSIPAGLPGDFNGDGTTDLVDFARLQVCFDDEAMLTGACEAVELNCDCALDLSDMPDFTSAMSGP